MPSLRTAMTVLLAACLANLRAGAEDVRPDRLEKALAHPTATGLMVLSVVEGSQAAARGIARGDIVVAYNGVLTPDLKALLGAMREAGEENVNRVPLTVMRDGRNRTFRLKPGTIGIQTVPVTLGKAVQLRPPATSMVFDFTRLTGKGFDQWYAFYIDGEKVGYEHNVLRLKDGKLLQHSEVAFDSGKDRWGLQHFVVDLVLTFKAKPEPLRSRYAFPLTGFVCAGRLAIDKKSGARRWNSTMTWSEPKDGKTVDKRQEKNVPLPADALPDYFATLLCAFLPREAGACYHYTLLSESSGDAKLPAALYAAREESTPGADGRPLRAWRFEQHLVGRVGRISWVDSGGRIAKNYYGRNTYSYRTTRAEAMAGVHAKLQPIGPIEKDTDPNE